MELDSSTAIGFLIAAAGGAVIGLERQHSGHASGPDAHFGGLRTFSLLGMMAGAAGLLWANQFATAGAILLAAASALIVAAYVAASRHDIDATTEMAGLVVLAAGTMAGLGWWAFSSAIFAVTSLLLFEKSRLHALTENLPDAGLQAGFRFAVMALVVLPLLPEGPYGPWGGVRPRELWVMVLLISGMSFAGYAARCFVGAGQGYVVTGMLGGLVSSTNTTLTLSRQSASEPASGTALAIGVIAACTVMYLRVAVAVAMLNPALNLELAPLWVPPSVAGAALTWFGLRRKDAQADAGPAPSNPLAFVASLQMALLFQAVLFMIHAVRGSFGDAGLLLSGAVLGLTDVDALTISMAKLNGTGHDLTTAALAIGVGCLANSFFKLGVAMVLGRGQFRKVVGAGFAVMIVAAAAGLAWKF